MKAELPSLPGPAETLKDSFGASYSVFNCEQMRQYALAAVAVEREECAQWKPPSEWEIVRAAEDVGMTGLAVPLSNGDRRLTAIGLEFVEAARRVMVLYCRKAQRHDKSLPLGPPPALGEGCKDAERYRWLRANCRYGFEHTSEPQLVHATESCPHEDVHWRENLDAAIDAAMAAPMGQAPSGST